MPDDGVCPVVFQAQWAGLSCQLLTVECSWADESNLCRVSDHLQRVKDRQHNETVGG